MNRKRLALLAVVIAFVATVAALRVKRPVPVAVPPGGMHTILVAVTGTAAKTQIFSAVNHVNINDQFDLTLPWQSTFRLKDGDTLEIFVHNLSPTGTLHAGAWNMDDGANPVLLQEARSDRPATLAHLKVGCSGAVVG